MNKVLQVVGSVIRTSEDYGVIALLDECFLQNSYNKSIYRRFDIYNADEGDTGNMETLCVAKTLKKDGKEKVI